MDRIVRTATMGAKVRAHVVVILALLLCASLAACGALRGDGEPTPAVGGTTTSGALTTPPGEPAVVEKIVDGDTFDVSTASGTFRVRLIGVDAPETQGPVGCYGNEAAAFTRQAIFPGTTVRLERDVSDTDRFERLLRYAYLPDGTMLNELLVREGFAYVVTYEPDVKYEERFREAERQARTASKGLWAKCRAGSLTTPSPAGPDGTLYDPFGPDRDCTDFPGWEIAQRFFEAAGGPAEDPHHIDDDGDGVACEGIPGAPG